MGYTHYFRNQKTIPARVWTTITDDVKKVLDNLPDHSLSAGGYYSEDPLKIAFENDLPDQAPQIDKTVIRFNGTGEGDLGHETFYITPNGPDGFNFCKTARKPYDLCACAILIIINHHAKWAFDISSDGDEEDWIPALKLVRNVLENPDIALPYKVVNPETED